MLCMGMFLMACGIIAEEVSIDLGSSVELKSEALGNEANLNYSSEQSGIVSFSEEKDEYEGINPTVTAVSPGTVKVIAKEGEKEVAVFNITVNVVPISEIILSTNEVEVIEGELYKINYTLLPTNASDYGLIWKSADDAVASVDEEGNISANKVGQTTIIISSDDGEITGKCSISVKQKDAYDRLTAQDKIFVDMFLKHIRDFKDPYSVKITGVQKLGSTDWCVGVSGTNGFGGASSTVYMIVDDLMFDLEDRAYMAMFSDDYDLNLINEALQEKLNN